MGNIKEFKALIKRYKSIDILDIKEYDIYYAAKELTGFSTHGCTLCIAVFRCDDCVWLHETNEKCLDSKNAETYDKIKLAETPKKLLKAFKKRAKYMKKVLTNK